MEDEAVVQLLTKTILERAGFSVITGDDGKEGLEQYSVYGSRLVAAVIDLSMPVINGAEAFEHIRSRNRDLFIVLTSGYQSEQLPRSFRNDSSAVFLPKPYSASDLLQSLSSCSGMRFVANG